jgi:hypothetical protein
MKLTIAEMEYNLNEMLNSKWYEKPTKGKKQYIETQRNLINWLKNTDCNAIEANFNMALYTMSVIEKRLPKKEDFKFDIAYENTVKKVKAEYNASFFQTHIDTLGKIIKLLKKNNEWKGQ